MITINVDGEDHVYFEFADMLIGDLFGWQGDVWCRCPVAIDSAGNRCNAVSLRMNYTRFFEPDTIVEPISMDWEVNENDEVE